MSETTQRTSQVFRRPDLSFQGWREYVRSTDRLDLSHATAKSYEAWYLARAALRFKLSKAVIIRDKNDLKNLETIRPGPKPHQIEGLLFFWNTAGKRCYFADDVGLGKTYTATLIVHQLIQYGYISKNSGRILVLCPKAVIEEAWKTAFEGYGIWTDSDVNDHPGYAAAYAGPWTDKAQYARILVTTYNSVQDHGSETGLRVSLMDVPPGQSYAWDLIVLDEAHRVKNLIKPGETLEPGTQKTRTQAYGAYQIANRTRFAILLCATPINNDLYDLFAQSLVCQGRDSPFVEEPEAVRFESDNISAFEGLFCADGKPGKWLKNHGEFGTRLDGFLMRTTRDKVKEEIPRRCVVSPRRLSRMVGLIPADSVRSDLMSKYSKAKRRTNSAFNEHRGGDPSIRVVTERAFLSSDEAVLEHLHLRTEKLQGLKRTPLPQADLFGQTEGLDAITAEEDCIHEIQEWMSSGELGEEPKLQLLRRTIDQAVAHCEKRGIKWQIVVFAFFKKTACYVANKLSAEPSFAGKVLCALDEEDALARQRLIKEEFCDASAKKESAKRKDKRILVATDALREGVNLQSANIVINYDLPWNPAHIEQRIGRLQRLKSPHRSVFVFNLFVPGAEIEKRINEILLVKAHLINECFLSTYKFGVGEDEEPDPEEDVRQSDPDKESMAEVFEAYLQAETEDEKNRRLQQLDELRRRADAQLKDFKESEERAKRERPPEAPPTPEETETRERLERLPVPNALLPPDKFALRWWRHNGIYPGPDPDGEGRYSVPRGAEEHQWWAVEKRAQPTDELLAPQSRPFLELCQQPLNTASVGRFKLQARDWNWKDILNEWLQSRYSNLNLIDVEIGPPRVAVDWAAELALRIFHHWKKDGPDEIQPLLKIETVSGLWESIEQSGERTFHTRRDAPPLMDQQAVIHLDSQIRTAAPDHEDLGLFASYYEKVFARHSRDIQTRFAEEPGKNERLKERRRRQLQPRLELYPGIFAAIEHIEADAILKVADAHGRVGQARLTVCPALGTVREEAFCCQVSKFRRPLDSQTLFITGDGKLVHADTQRRVCAESGDEFSVDDYATFLDQCSFTGALFRKQHMRTCKRCGRRGWYRMFAPVGKANDEVCPLCYEYSNGRKRPAAPEEFRTCPVSGTRDTEEFFRLLDDRTSRLVHESQVVICDVGPRICLKQDVLRSDVSDRTAHKTQFTRGALSGKNLLKDDRGFTESPSGRSDTAENFNKSWIDDAPWLEDEFGACPHCKAQVPAAMIGGGRCIVCRDVRGKPKVVTAELERVLPPEVFQGTIPGRHCVTVVSKAHVQYVEVYKKRPFLLRFLKPRLHWCCTHFREAETDPWTVISSKPLSGK